METGARIGEGELVPHALRLLDRVENRACGLPVAELIALLRALLRPTGDDLASLEGRADDRFAQKVRNLRSHRTLERAGLVVLVEDDAGRHGRLVITEAGRAFLEHGGAEDGAPVQLRLDLGAPAASFAAPPDW